MKKKKRNKRNLFYKLFLNIIRTIRIYYNSKADIAIANAVKLTPVKCLLCSTFLSTKGNRSKDMFHISIILTNSAAGKFPICIYSVGIGLCKATASSYYPIDQYGATTFPLICMEDTFPNMYPRYNFFQRIGLRPILSSSRAVRLSVCLSVTSPCNFHQLGPTGSSWS